MTINIPIKSCHNKVLNDAYYVSKFTHNLLSLGQLMDGECTFKFVVDK